MKTCVTVGEFLENNGKLEQGRLIYVSNSIGTLDCNGRVFEEVDKKREFITVHYACNMEKIHVEACFVQIEVTPTWK